MASVPVDQEKVHDFVGKVLGDTSGLTTTILAALGDRLNLFKTLAAHGPATSAELAKAASINERYAREWLGAWRARGTCSTTRRRAGSRCHPSTCRSSPPRRGRCTSAASIEMLLGTFGVLDRSHRVHARRGRLAAGVLRELVGRHGALHRRVVREPAPPAMDPGHAARARGARARRRRRRRRLQPGARAMKLARAFPSLTIRRVRRLRASHPPGDRAVRRCGPERPRPLRAARRVEGAARAVRRHHHVRRDSRRRGPPRTVADDSRRAAAGRNVRVPRHELLRQARGERGHWARCSMASACCIA